MAIQKWKKCCEARGITFSYDGNGWPYVDNLSKDYQSPVVKLNKQQ